MALTAQTVVDLARKPLKDAAKARWSDADLLTYYNQGILMALDRRPELFVGSYASLPANAETLGSTFPLPARYLQAIADWITGSCDLEENEVADEGRADMMMKKFLIELGVSP